MSLKTEYFITVPHDTCHGNLWIQQVLSPSISIDTDKNVILSLTLFCNGISDLKRTDVVIFSDSCVFLVVDW